MSLRVFVFGPGVGESIVIQFPSNVKGQFCWGVIDCHSERVLQFLRDENGVDELDFVCWTHPHGDHQDGMPALLNSYQDRVKRFWRFGGTNAAALSAYTKLWSRDNDVIEESELKPIEAILDFALEKRKVAPDTYKSLTDINESLFSLEYDDKSFFKISSLSPSSSLADTYSSYLGKCVKEDKPLDWEAFDGKHNMISVVFLIEFGETRLLFGSDAEEPVWEQIFDSEQRKNLSIGLSSHFVKISHHGSAGAYHKDSWLEIAYQDQPYGVMTPFTRSDLPRKEGMELLKKHCAQICLTATKKNYNYYGKANSKSTKYKYKWKTYRDDADYCVFEFDKTGRPPEVKVAASALVF